MYMKTVVSFNEDIMFQHGIFKYYHSCKKPVTIQHGHDEKIKL